MKSISTIREIHDFFKIKKPLNPFISIVDTNEINMDLTGNPSFKVDLYQIWLKDGLECTIGYGRTIYDFKNGSVYFVKKGQIISDIKTFPKNSKSKILIIHPELIINSTLENEIKSCYFFDYSVNEALHISKNEFDTLNFILNNINEEINSDVDLLSKKLIHANISLFLNYCKRYYDRQFNDRKKLNTILIEKLESILIEYYAQKSHLKLGLPTVKFLSKEINLSSNYLGDLIRKEIGISAQEYIHKFIIEKAKNILLDTNHSVSEIAFNLGFEYPQHFSKLFKSKTGFNPTNFRNSP